MPTYCYTHEATSRTIEREARMSQIPKFVVEHGFLYHRDVRAEHAKQKSGDAWTEHWSLAMGGRTKAHEREIAGKLRAANLPCEFDSIGRLKVSSAKQQRAMAKAIIGPNGKNLDSYY